MKDFQGTCLLRLPDGSEYQEVAITISAVPPKHAGSLYSWHGSLRVPDGVSDVELMEAKTATIQLSDWRSGEIGFTGTNAYTASFQGVGSLE